MHPEVRAPAHTNSSKPIRFILLGALFWFAAAMLIRFLGPYALTDGNPLRALMFFITVPITIGFLATAKMVGRVPWSHLLRPVVIMSYTAAFLDGIALTWLREIYAKSYETALFGAALILWGVAVALCMAHVLEQLYDSRP